MVDDGIYAAYLTGRAAQGVAFLIFQDGNITGADLGGFWFDGSIDGQAVDLTVRAKGGVPTIHGNPTPSEGLIYKLTFDIPDDPNKYVAIRTPYGPVNVKLEKIRDLGALEESP